MTWLFKQIQQDCQKNPDESNKIQISSGHGSLSFTESPMIIHLCVTHPSEILVNIIFKYIHIQSTYTITPINIVFGILPFFFTQSPLDSMFSKKNQDTKRLKTLQYTYNTVTHVIQHVINPLLTWQCWRAWPSLQCSAVDACE